MAMPPRPTYMFLPLATPSATSTATATATAASPATPHPHPHPTTPGRNVTAMIHSPERNAMLCRYPSKLCDMMRSEKRGGGLHRFCAYHRERANINQRRVDHRRRLRKKGLPVPPLERAPSHYQALVSPRQHDDEILKHEDTTVKMEQVQQQHDQMLDVDLFDAVESVPPLLPDFSETDLQELMHLLDHVDTDSSAFSIKEEHGAEATR